MARSMEAATGRAACRAKGTTRLAAVAGAWRPAKALIVRPSREHSATTRSCAVPCCGSGLTVTARATHPHCCKRRPAQVPHVRAAEHGGR